MSEEKTQSIVERVEAAPYENRSASNLTIAFHDHAVHLALTNETAMAVGRHGGDDLLMLVDSHTASQVHALNELRLYAQRVIVFGGVPQKWAKADNVTVRADSPWVQPADHVFVLFSSKISMAALGSVDTVEHDDDAPFDGAWGVDRDYVGHTIKVLAGEEGTELADKITVPLHWSPQMVDLSMRLMNLHASSLANRQHDIAMDKSDLFSVLNILKAISAKRRAHDILFVFVEQIARVISSERCSIVRVWRNEKHGQVLASHEDANVAEREIEIDKYPEIEKAMASEKKVVVNDVRTDPLTSGIADVLKEAGINAILVIPIVLHDQHVGSLMLRAARGKGSFSLREISFFEIVTEAASNALERAQLFESIQTANENLERLAITDGLTGLHNHRFFRDRLQQELERAQRYRLPLACIIFDVDDFKAFNDTYGHLQGDAILREIAERTTHCVRKSDVVARYGGEEFVIIMPQTDIVGAVAQAERVRQTIASRSFRGMPADKRVTVSLGVGIFAQDKTCACEDIIREADQALYRAKRTGKNKVVGPETEDES